MCGQDKHIVREGRRCPWLAEPHATPRFVLLHTLGHLLINQLIFHLRLQLRIASRTPVRLSIQRVVTKWQVS